MQRKEDEDEWENKEQLTAGDLEKLFKGDVELLDRLKVKTYKEMIRLADNDGRHFLPYKEVKDIIAKENERSSSRATNDR